ncbi:MAG TPA: TonB-dependent receptor plug domain-containing protein, partial [Bacteroidales bacterium]|nr:TonB-dependent receptor plug domain-containing protein [Bacteroidales bacterium]
METRQLDSIRITADRVLKDMGIQKTVIDTLALRESISGSLASVLTQNSTLFIKSYGRATLSTASFRGTAPSHTQVTWNGMKLNSPMLGMVDFSQIPSYF